jgi:hypothetical protein
MDLRSRKGAWVLGAALAVGITQSSAGSITMFDVQNEGPYAGVPPLPPFLIEVWNGGIQTDLLSVQSDSSDPPHDWISEMFDSGGPPGSIGQSCGGADRDTSNPSFSEITFTKWVDSASPLLAQTVVSGEALCSIEFATPAPGPYQVYQLDFAIPLVQPARFLDFIVNPRGRGSFEIIMDLEIFGVQNPDVPLLELTLTGQLIPGPAGLAAIGAAGLVASGRRRRRRLQFTASTCPIAAGAVNGSSP